MRTSATASAPVSVSPKLHHDTAAAVLDRRFRTDELGVAIHGAPARLDTRIDSLETTASRMFRGRR